MNFVAIDFETATFDRMACQVGITIVKEGEIIDTFEKLIQPPRNYYDYANINVHHITPEMTKDAPTFDKVWEEISDYIIGKVVVAHNAAFDEDVLYKNLSFYGIQVRGIMPFFCTYKLMAIPLLICAICLKLIVENTTMLPTIRDVALKCSLNILIELNHIKLRKKELK